MWGTKGLSRLYLVVEVTEKQNKNHEKVCNDIRNAVIEKGLSKKGAQHLLQELLKTHGIINNLSLYV